MRTKNKGKKAKLQRQQQQQLKVIQIELQSQTGGPSRPGLILVYGIFAFETVQSLPSFCWPSGTPFTFMAKQETLLPHQKYFGTNFECCIKTLAIK